MLFLLTGGLINAYRSAAADALAQSDIKTKTVNEVFEIKFPYSAMNRVMKVLKEEHAEQVKQNFGMECMIRIRLPREKSKNFIARLNSIDSMSINKLLITY